ncbi:MFS family permease [Luteibacter sp. Sphag1AF]|uniref:MFS transporter n=1 Tax=Luteibacter sp. Sphag1AF TaxID=2587031 RepID=UPI0016223B35|nr:MFS transporter [Luteibacter sp. Sphag1AF]MBB3225981.1 MFS family permease [Luteibacter sp. Sphag1AF]
MSPSALPDLVPHRGRRFAITARILSAVVFSFLCYLSIGIPLAVIPGFVHMDLGYATVWAGLAVSVQYLATLLSRPHAGRLADIMGPKKTVCIGLGVLAVSGVFLVGCGLLRHAPLASMGMLLGSRLALGFAESWVSTGSITWGIGGIGGEHTARVISWNGIATYGGIALGAPLGVILARDYGVVALGVLTFLLGALALPFALWKRKVPPTAGERLPFRSVVARVMPYGVGLALGSIGFGVLSTFVALYYSSRQWPDAALSLSVFGGCFIGIRLILGNAINRFGGYRVAMASLAVECVGLILLWHASTPLAALIGAAMTGSGFALVFPALGVEAVGRVSMHNRGAALGAYSVFLDVALGLTGPVGGWVAGHYDYPAIFLLASGCSIVAALLSGYLFMRYGRSSAQA